VLYEDEGQEEMGETEVHGLTSAIIWFGIKAHLAPQPRYRVLSDVNCYYHPIKRSAYFSADTMVVAPPRPLRALVRTYRIGPRRPPPLLTVEVLSRRSFQQQDLTNKPDIYADTGVAEYILVDVTGEYLPERLRLRRLRGNRSWSDHQDPDGGVTSQLGFRLIIDRDGQVRVVDAATGWRYPRPDEADAEARARQLAEEARRQAEETRRQAEEARRQAEERAQALEAELQRLRGTPPSGPAEARRKR
jgi:Uma2 family endonuclease